MLVLPFTIGTKTGISPEHPIRSDVSWDGPLLRVLLVEFRRDN